MKNADAIDALVPSTFDREIRASLEKNHQLIADYFREDAALMDRHLKSSPYESLQPNKYASRFYEYRDESLAPILRDKTFRLWHYTRLREIEVASLKRKISLASLAGLRRRIRGLQLSGTLSNAEAKCIYEQSPYRSQDMRLGQFWTVSHPVHRSNSGVELLLGYWGGESAYFWLRDEALKEKLQKIGKPRIVEIAATNMDELQCWKLSDSITSAYARSLGLQAENTGSDMNFTNAANLYVIRVHTEGDHMFDEIGATYPRD